MRPIRSVSPRSGRRAAQRLAVERRHLAFVVLGESLASACALEVGVEIGPVGLE
jgi:hypothetical protein